MDLAKEGSAGGSAIERQGEAGDASLDLGETAREG
jgi:hypothetical protein